MSGLVLEAVSAHYGDVQALWDVSLSVAPGRLVTLLGANGAGKTTTLRTICGQVKASAGTVRYDGREITRCEVHEVADLGITLVPEGRQLFPQMTVEENLLVGSYLPRTRANRKRNLSRVYDLFPRLAERRSQRAETLSGGEQQMLAIGRGLMQEPHLIMFDEPSLGLAPILVREIFGIIRELHRQGLTIFLVEQNVHHAIRVADYCYVIENGRVVREGAPLDLEADPAIRQAYLGL
ncbi:MAG: ABC transporter ATP-binding protein [Deltaproteobacteria bacterium]|nr:ABC transporter ATP-binding protein [Deltaproteobacteria bacterium]